MRSFTSISLLSLLFGLSLLIVSCGNGPSSDQVHTEDSHMEETHTEDTPTEAAAHGEGLEFNSDYVCPMHCEGSGSDEPGTCPVCGMEYVSREDHMADGHMHDQ